MISKTPIRLAMVGAILMAGSLTAEVWAQEAPQAPVPPTAQSETAPLDTSAMNVEEMEAKLQEMNKQLQTLSAELERTNQQSRELVEQALVLVREQQSVPNAETAEPVEAAAAPAPAVKIQLNLPQAAEISAEIAADIEQAHSVSA